jgi:hypothetical protein
MSKDRAMKDKLPVPRPSGLPIRHDRDISIVVGGGPPPIRAAIQLG